MLVILKTLFYFDNKLIKPLTKDALFLQHTLLKPLIASLTVIINLFTSLI
jgi:hypothetical protein